MQSLKCALAGLAVAGLGVATADAAVVTITGLDIRSGGVFGQGTNVTGVTINGNAPAGTVTADPIDVAMTYSNLDLDGDGTANDSVNFTVRYAGGTGQRIFNQGVDTGFGSLSNVTATVIDVSGVTTDLGNPIVFDGFTGATVAGGGPNNVTGSADVNGVNVPFAATNDGGFAFGAGSIDFAATASVLFTNGTSSADSGGVGGSVVARAFDLQFSAIPEPASLALLGLGGLAMLARGRRA